MKTSELLRKAADEIRRRGWHQGANGSDYDDSANCSVCAMGAIRVALSGSPWGRVDFKREWDLIDAVAVAGPGADYSVHGWNDSPGRTVEEVLDVFEKAAVAAELEES